MNDLLTMTRVPANELNKALDMMHDAMFGLEELMGQHPDERLQEVRESIIRAVFLNKDLQANMRHTQEGFALGEEISALIQRPDAASAVSEDVIISG